MDFRSQLQAIILALPAVLIACTFHEYAHALVADKLGDKTPRFQGRLTLNPIAHIDPIGFLMFVVFHFGWAKPVETNPGAYKNYYKDDLKVTIAGPLANLLIGFVFAFVTVIIGNIYNKTILSGTNNYLIVQVLYYIAQYITQLNCMFFILNLIPIPGFDGFHILRDLSPRTFYNISDAFYRYQLIILVALILPIFGGYSILSIVAGIPGSLICNGFLKIAYLVFG
ncbi:MAG: site-2 protease family protein [Clostridium sp.]|nr:site-2 protease family protein [Clostridium sp.]